MCFYSGCSTGTGEDTHFTAEHHNKSVNPANVRLSLKNSRHSSFIHFFSLHKISPYLKTAHSFNFIRLQHLLSAQEH